MDPELLRGASRADNRSVSDHRHQYKLTCDASTLSRILPIVVSLLNIYVKGAFS